MAKGYRPVRRDQPFLLPPDMREWLPLIGLFVSDAGYLSEHNLTIPGPDRLIAAGTRRTPEHAARDNDPATSRPSQHITAMTRRLATPGGITVYRQRGHIAETPHGQIKHNMGFRRLTMAERAAPRGR
jgi:hypothetical protein